ncbi:hypothetical protein [Paracraurococcus lichenis]|uniref:Uncharacterized protein n=1 Tax=Paracraurococcus lichenis TaxID=3064888 RepID=A0ABT9DYF2_9PROT|nr:hypothetical protein [Paracraurococcus sp. LOR1-02]MDO9708932.1 hypothetical protein [Paracraurococcus sp. LOR1-02]
MQGEVTSIADERLIRGVPDHPVPLAKDDRDYIEACLHAVEHSFGVVAFGGTSLDAVPARTLMRRMMQWWRGLDPVSPAQQVAHHDLPGAIMLLEYACVGAWNAAEDRADAVL